MWVGFNRCQAVLHAIANAKQTQVNWVGWSDDGRFYIERQNKQPKHEYFYGPDFVPLFVARPDGMIEIPESRKYLWPEEAQTSP